MIVHASHRLSAEEWRLAVWTVQRSRRERTAGASWMTLPACCPGASSPTMPQGTLRKLVVVPVLWVALLLAALQREQQEQLDLLVAHRR